MVPTALEALETSQGRRGHSVDGLLIGAGVGLAVGLIGTDFGTNTASCKGSGDYGTFCELVIAGSIAGRGLLGTLVGALVRTER